MEIYDWMIVLALTLLRFIVDTEYKKYAFLLLLLLTPEILVYIHECVEYMFLWRRFTAIVPRLLMLYAFAYINLTYCRLMVFMLIGCKVKTIIIMATVFTLIALQAVIHHHPVFFSLMVMPAWIYGIYVEMKSIR